MTERSGSTGDRPREGAEGVSAPPIDPERIAALLDGRLDDRERAELLAQLDATPSAFEPFVDAIAVLRELEGGAGAAPTAVVPMDAARRTRRRPPRLGAWLAVAAALVIAIAGPMLWRTRDRGVLESPAAVLARIEPAGAALPDDWRAASWAERRGASEGLSSRAAAVRIGARVTDHELLARAGDEAAPRVAMQVAALLDDLPAGSAAGRAYSALADGRPHSADERQRAMRAAEQIAGSREVRAGAWLEAARLAAARHDSAFFHAPQARAAAAELSRLADDARAATEAATRLRAAITDPVLDWQALGNTLSDLLRALGQ